jgi:hypothetical protein
MKKIHIIEPIEMEVMAFYSSVFGRGGKGGEGGDED